ncbi:MAG: bifunctional glutamate N-acetyltransferase/amino-acid acetyltransferase ArgJ [Candidatus Acidiferrales bacterium]
MSRLRLSRNLLLPKGFLFAAAAAGLKKTKTLDVALAEAVDGASAAAVFTSNRVVAAPVLIGRRHLLAARGRVRAVIVNSGNANCATGGRGLRVCERICRELARLLRVPARAVFPSSTGVIGVPLPAQRVVQIIPRLLSERNGSRRALLRFAHAIMTTDTRPKMASASFRCAGGTAVLMGVAKGAGMIHPRLATMLVYLFTDVAATPSQLHQLLPRACARTFNRISVDGDTSTNDTVLLLASGASGLSLRTRSDKETFAAALETVCASLAQQIVEDGEGAGHVVELRIEGARHAAEAERVARAIAHSPLVKTAWAGADPNWGRILAAVGASGVPVEARVVDIFLGSQQVCRAGTACRFDERLAHRELSRRRFRVRVRLGRGRAATTFWTTDLTTDYVRINASYRS